MPLLPTRAVERFAALPGSLKGVVTIIVAGFLFTIMTAAIKLAGERLHVTQILLVRQIVMTAIVAPAILSSFPGCLRTARVDLQITRIVFALIAMLFGFYAIIHMPLADAMAIGFVKAFFVTVFAIWILGETVGWRRWIATAVGFAGVLVMIRPGTEGFDPTSIYALIGAACAGFVMVIIRKLSRTDAPLTTLSWQAIFVGLAVAGPAIWFWQWPSFGEWALLISVGLVGYIAQMCNIYAYGWGEASLLASLDYIRLLWATVIGFALFGTLPGVWTWAGAAIIIGASIYTIFRERQKQQELVRSPQGRGLTHH